MPSVVAELTVEIDGHFLMEKLNLVLDISGVILRQWIWIWPNRGNQEC